MHGRHPSLRRFLLLGIALATAVAAGSASATPDDSIRWRVRMLPEHRDFFGVWVDTRELDVERSLGRVTFEVSCLDGDGVAIQSVVFPFTDEVRPSLERGVVYLRYYRHSCAQAHRIIGTTLRYTETGRGDAGASGLAREGTATLRNDRIRAPSRQVELIGASPFRNTDPSAYCGPLSAQPAPSP
jgi:hypothetical protein